MAEDCTRIFEISYERGLASSMSKLTPKEIKELIKNSEDLTQTRLSKYCSVSKSTVSKWLNEHQAIPDKQMKNILKYLENETFKETGNTKTLDVSKYELIKEDLQNQLEQQNKFGNQYDDLLDHAIYLFKLKDELQHDIETNGIRILAPTGNGHKRMTDNTSIRNLHNTSTQLLRVLKDLGLNEPEVEERFELDDFL